MSIVAWLLVGLSLGLIGNQFVHRSSRGIVGAVAVGTLGAFSGGFVYNLFFDPGTGIAAVNLWSIPVAALGSVIFLVPHYRWRSIPNR